jgi:hypothetical protein
MLDFNCNVPHHNLLYHKNVPAMMWTTITPMGVPSCDALGLGSRGHAIRPEPAYTVRVPVVSGGGWR